MTERKYPVRKLDLAPPSLDELASAISSGVQSNFAVASVDVATPPDLRESPWHLAGPGLSGNARVADVGGPPNLLPTPNLDAKYDLLAISELMDMSPAEGMLIGAGAGPFHVLGLNTELMPNVAYGSFSGGVLQNRTHYAKVTEDGSVKCEEIGASTGFGLMCNLFGCSGETGPALHITAKGRTGKDNFTQSIQNAIKAVYGERLVSLGGVFVIRAGRANLHVMPDFPGTPFRDHEEVEHWIQYFDTDAPLVCLSVLHSGNDGGLDLRMEHTHCFAADGPDADKRGGHYHFDLDTTMGDVEYEAWFNVAETLYRIDQPGVEKP